MELYDIKGKALNFDIHPAKTAIGAGEWGLVHKLTDGRCLKVFDVANKRNITDMDVFTELMSLDIDNFYKVYQILYGDYNEETKKHFKSRHEMIRGYLMKYYSHDIKNILEVPTEYLLDNINDLYQTIKLFSERHINGCDMHAENIILNKDRMVLIDADGYYRDDSYDLFYKNKKHLFYGLTEMLLQALCKNYNYVSEERCNMSRVIMDLLDYKDGPTIIKSRIKSYKKPIDYVRSGVNR